MTGGRPYFWKISALIEERGGEEWFFGEIANNVFLIDLAAQLGCSRNLLYQWINETPERKDAFARARELQAHSIVEDEAREAKEQPPRTPVEAQVQSTNLKRAQWRAGKLNREAYGDDKGAQLVVNIASLHEDALRSRVLEAKPQPPALPSRIVEAQVVEE